MGRRSPHRVHVQVQVDCGISRHPLTLPRPCARTAAAACAPPSSACAPTSRPRRPGRGSSSSSTRARRGSPSAAPGWRGWRWRTRSFTRRWTWTRHPRVREAVRRDPGRGAALPRAGRRAGCAPGGLTAHRPGGGGRDLAPGRAHGRAQPAPLGPAAAVGRARRRRGLRRPPPRARAHCLSTLEAIALALCALERDAPRFEPMREAFRRMVAQQLECARGARRNPRHRPGRGKARARRVGRREPDRPPTCPRPGPPCPRMASIWSMVSFMSRHGRLERRRGGHVHAGALQELDRKVGPARGEQLEVAVAGGGAAPSPRRRGCSWPARSRRSRSWRTGTRSSRSRSAGRRPTPPRTARRRRRRPGRGRSSGARSRGRARLSFSPVSASPFSARSWMASSNSANMVWRKRVVRRQLQVLAQQRQPLGVRLGLGQRVWKSRFSFRVEATSATKIAYSEVG